MSETAKLYTVKYETIPSPAYAYYRGEVVVAAEDEEDAEFRAKKEVSRRAHFPFSCLRVTSIKEKS